MDDAAGRQAAAVSFSVLGPLLVRRDDEAVPVGGPQERTVLAHLLARANGVVPVGTLVETVWGDDPPPSAERALQAHVARLRRVFEPDRPPSVGSTLLVKAGAGYSLRVDDTQVDALRFEALAQRVPACWPMVIGWHRRCCGRRWVVARRRVRGVPRGRGL